LKGRTTEMQFVATVLPKVHCCIEPKSTHLGTSNNRDVGFTK
jgi:hypothetical protein